MSDVSVGVVYKQKFDPAMKEAEKLCEGDLFQHAVSQIGGG